MRRFAVCLAVALALAALAFSSAGCGLLLGAPAVAGGGPAPKTLTTFHILKTDPVGHVVEGPDCRPAPPPYSFIADLTSVELTAAEEKLTIVWTTSRPVPALPLTSLQVADTSGQVTSMSWSLSVQTIYGRQEISASLTAAWQVTVTVWDTSGNELDTQTLAVTPVAQGNSLRLSLDLAELSDFTSPFQWFTWTRATVSQGGGEPDMVLMDAMPGNRISDPNAPVQCYTYPEQQ